ncbi:hypothetical protein [Flavobacterium soli]|uniref:hypothetical protein n=1 Tax=Flavobacterium soli TaxID=344881 RepID=UPI0012F91ACB|nr:hypothetical protein [Flavobacterium soli]
MKKIVLLAMLSISCLSMISCTAEAIEDTNPATVVADGEPINTPIKPPPPPPPGG